MQPGEDCWLKVFTTLLRLDKGIYIEKFWSNGILDRRLPITKGDLSTSLKCMLGGTLNDEDQNFADAFCSLQYELLTADSLSENGRVLNSMTVLPITTYVPIKPDGQPGLEKIFQIEIPYGCIPPKILKKVTAKPYKMADDDDEKYLKFAIKTLRDFKEYQQETFAYIALKGREGIVQCLGFWELTKPSGESEYHLLLEYGHYDLHEYFEKFPHPSLPQDIIQFWKDLSNVAIALDRIHNMELPSENGTNSWLGWHLDIKPENILFCEGGWKIADPGFAQFSRHEKADKDEDKMPVVTLRGGTTRYGPPEQCLDHGKLVTQRFDMWSLGCVFSEAATWLLLGCRGVEQFRLVRKCLENGNMSSISFTEPRGDDCFHNREDVSKAVVEWHRYLKNSLRSGDSVTGLILDFIEGKMLVYSIRDRTTSRDLVNWLKNTIATAEKDENLSKYRPPKFFRKAFEAEQRKTAEDWANPPSQALRRTNRYKSMRYENAPSNGQDSLAYDAANIHTPLLTSPFPDLQLSKDPGMPRGSTMSSQMTRESLAVTTTHGINSNDLHGQDRAAYRHNDETERFDFWDALLLLESKGWIRRRTLQRVSEYETQQLLSQTVSDSTSSLQSRGKTPLRPVSAPNSTPRSSRTQSMGSALRDLFSSRSKTQKYATTSPSHGEQSVTPKTSRHPLSVQAHRRITSDMTSHSKVDMNYRTSDFDQFLDKRDIVFLLNNGSTMGDHWPRARDLVAVLVALLHGQDDNGLELYFTSSKKPFGPFVEPREFVDTIDLPINKPRVSQQADDCDEQGFIGVKNGSADNIKEVLFHILDLVGKASYARKLTLIIFTDGIWKGVEEKETVADGISHHITMWADRNKDLKELMKVRGLSLQFVQFGNDPDATAMLEDMDNHLVNPRGVKQPDIIDVEPATGNVKKMILGSLSDQWDDHGHTTATSGGPPSVMGQNDFRTSTLPGSMASPNQYQEPPRFPAIFEDPSEYSTSSGRPHLYSGGDTVLGAGTQFGPTSGPTFMSRETLMGPRRFQGAETPSRYDARKKRATEDSSNTVVYGRDHG
ncbi:hypothetical protein WAI453_002575 [Rhynchosporium graminicola]